MKLEGYSELMEKVLELKKSGKVIDLGCGEGQNAVFLAKNGFDVLAIDNLQLSVYKTSRLGYLNDVFVNAVMKDIRNFRTSEKYDVIICLGVLHFLKKDEAKEILRYMRKISNIGAVHVIETFLLNELSKEGEDDGYYGPGELKELYSDWNIIEYKEYFSSKENKNVARIIALKLS